MHQNVLKIYKMFISQIMENWDKPFALAEAEEDNMLIVDDQKAKKSRNALT
jgi:hypothetical protein